MSGKFQDRTGRWHNADGAYTKPPSGRNTMRGRGVEFEQTGGFGFKDIKKGFNKAVEFGKKYKPATLVSNALATTGIGSTPAGMAIQKLADTGKMLGFGKKRYVIVQVKKKKKQTGGKKKSTKKK